MAVGSGKIQAADIIGDDVKQALKDLGLAIDAIATKIANIATTAKQTTVKATNFGELGSQSKGITENAKAYSKVMDKLNEIVSLSNELVNNNATQNAHLSKTLKELTESLKEKNKQTQKSKEDDKQASIEARKLTEEKKKQAIAERELAKQQEVSAKRSKLMANIDSARAGNMSVTKETNKLLEFERKNIDAVTMATKEGAEKYAELTRKINENKEAIQKASAANRESKKAASEASAMARKQAIEDQKIARLQTIAESFKPGTIEAYVAQNKLLKAQMAQLNPTIAAQKEQFRLLNDQYNKNNASIKDLRTNQTTLGKSFKNLLIQLKSVALAYVGVQAIMSGIRKIFTDTRVIDQMTFSMQTVIKSSEELGQTQDFLSTISKNYGLNLIALTERYVKFRAATISTKLAVEDTQKIFDSFAKASGVLGLKTDEVSGVFLALEQMLSKGKITTEELRRQLGERLPGAFNIMATSIGVSTSELDKMLKKGEVISADVLPKFAETMERVYGIEYINRIDTLAAAQGRLNTSWLDFVKAINASSSMKGLINSINNELAGLTFTIEQLNGVMGEKFQSTWNDVVETFLSGGMNQAFKYASKWIKDLTYLIGGKKDSLYNYLVTTSEEIRTFVSELEKIPTDKLEDFRQSYVESIKDINGISKREAEDFVDYYIQAQRKEEEQRVIQQRLADRMKVMSIEQLQKWADYYYRAADIYGKKGDEFFRKENIALGETFSKEIGRRQEDKKEEPDLPKGDKYTVLEQMKNRQERLLADMMAEQERYMKTRMENEETIRELTFANGLLILQQEEKNLTERLGLFKAGTEDYDKILTEMAEKRVEIESYITKNEIEENATRLEAANKLAEAKLKTQQKLAEDEAQMGEITIDETMAKQIAARQTAATTEIQQNRLNAKKVSEIQGQAEVDILNIMKQYMLYKQNLFAEGTVEYAYWQKEQAKIQEAIEKQKQDNIVATAKVSQEQQQKLISFFGEQVNAGFDVIRSFQKEDSELAEQIYKRDMILAGDSAQAKIDADVKLYKAKKREAKKQAALEKAQAVFNIGLSTAQAIMGIWAQVPKFDFGISAAALTAIVTAMGLAQMAAVLAQPVPAFEKGGIVEQDGSVMVGEKGKELAILPTGQKFITPEVPSILNMPKGTEIIPHDETQKLLANAARNNFIHETIDLSTTNNYLREIRDKETVNVVGGYKYVSKNGLKGRYAIGI